MHCGYCFSGGLFGNLIVYYSTAMIDLLTLADDMIPVGGDNTWFYQSPYAGYINSSSAGITLDKSSQSNPLLVSTRLLGHYH